MLLGPCLGNCGGGFALVVVTPWFLHILQASFCIGFHLFLMMETTMLAIDNKRGNRKSAKPTI
jgi:hypothetical protein